MELVTLMDIIKNNFFANFVATYISTSVFDFTFDSLKNKFSKRSLSWQVLDCLQKAHLDTCEKLGWEYNPDAFLNSLLTTMSNDPGVFSKTSLYAAFVNAMGHPVNTDEIKCWEHSFLSCLAKKEYEQLREYIKLSYFLEKISIHYQQKLYLRRFNQPQIFQENLYLSLSDLYIPNQYTIGNNPEVFNDLLELIHVFVQGDIDNWLSSKGTMTKRNINALFIYGYQCTGKSSLISKIVSDYYKNERYSCTPLHLVSFSDKYFRDKKLCKQSVCEYLSITPDQLLNALLLIDGLDESNYSSSTALVLLEDFISDLQELNCRLIITSRPSFRFTDELMDALDISLKPFSAEQAEQWLIKYNSVFNSCDVCKMTRHICSLSPEIQNVILIPYIFQICVMHDVAIDKITGLAELYDLLFYGDDAKFFKSTYNSKPRNKVKEWRTFLKKIICISISYFNSSDNEIPVASFVDGTDSQDNLFATEFFLFRKDNNTYSFIHDSIPNYFISRYLFDSMISSFAQKECEKIAICINNVLSSERILTDTITDFIKYFVCISNQTKYIDAIDFLKEFLHGSLNRIFTISADLNSIQKYYYQRFVSILGLVFAFVAPNVRPFSCFDFFGLLNEDETKQFIMFSNLGCAALDCLKICTFTNKVLNGINLNGTHLGGKNMVATVMQNSTFTGATLSGAYLLNSDFSLSNFDNANCRNADFSACTLFGCSFRNARLNGANFSNANLTNADLRGAKLVKAKFGGATFKGAKISSEQLREIYDFDIPFIKENQIKVYSGEYLVTDELLAEEFQKQRPVAYAFCKYERK